MAKDLPYFKFFVSEWSDGDITLESYEVQGVFINICSYYWSNGCDVSYSKLIKKFKDCTDSVEVLENEGIIKIEGEMVFINFLDEQLGDRKQTSNQNSKAGKASAEKRRLAKLEQEANENPTPVEIPLNGNTTIKKREEKRRREKNKIFKPPTREEVIQYFDEKGYTEISAKKAFDYYDASNWVDGQGNKVKSWKQKMIGVWFKEENQKPSEKPTQVPKAIHSDPVN